ncbi:MAG TPA: thiamine pyrophosphate-binding protein [Jatrophihabitans sp.]|nr:thiamine pyrophosphate-binding protein [Jatrophihabitans sp.]
MSVERPQDVEATARTAEFGSDIAAQTLRTLGYRYLPLNPGSSFRGLHDSVVNFGGNRDPQLLLCLHEEIAVSMAHAYAKASGQPAAAAVHDLVGLMHASMAVFNAACDQVPVMIIGGSGPADPTARRPIDWIHSASTQAQLVRDYVKWDTEATVPAVFASSLERAHAIARTGPPGPVYVSLDAQAQEIRLSSPVPASQAGATAVPALYPDPADLERAVEALLGAERVTVVAGRLLRDAGVTAVLVDLVELLGAAYQDERNTVCFPTSHPQNLDGDKAALADCDVVLAIGVGDVPGTVASVQETAPTVVELSYGDLGLRSWSQERAPRRISDVLVVADPHRAAAALLDRLRDKLDPDARAVQRAALGNRSAALREQLRERRQVKWDAQPISATRMVSELWESVHDTDWLLLLRNTRSWPEDVWQFRGVGDFLGHSVGAGVGYGPGAMVGGALAARDMGRLGVGIVGDGDFLMAAGALWTAVHYEIPLLVVVNDNSSFYNDEEHQAEVARHRGRPVENSWIGMRMADPAIDIAVLSRSYGCWAAGPVTDPGELRSTFDAARDEALAGRVAVVQVRTDPK